MSTDAQGILAVMRIEQLSSTTRSPRRRDSSRFSRRSVTRQRRHGHPCRGRRRSGPGGARRRERRRAQPQVVRATAAPCSTSRSSPVRASPRRSTRSARPDSPSWPPTARGPRPRRPPRRGRYGPDRSTRPGPSHRVGLRQRGMGLLPEDRELADAVVSVPIRGLAESLNLATAATVCLYASSRAHRPRPADETL
ncbi:hypothetical protein NKG05_30470 [Oerskovia sp. M15]